MRRFPIAAAAPDPERSDRRRDVLKWAALVAAVLAISICHYLTPAAHFQFHVVYQRLYYLPILFGAFGYGLAGGMAVAVVTALPAAKPRAVFPIPVVLLNSAASPQAVFLSPVVLERSASTPLAVLALPVVL